MQTQSVIFLASPFYFLAINALLKDTFSPTLSLRFYISYSTPRIMNTYRETYQLGTTGDHILTVKYIDESTNDCIIIIRQKDSNTESIYLPPKRLG